ncbi:hypothetical protein RIF29_29800 [Crotalaria pallida]|uniref:Late embryogenesis abundant protein n=1 Tax=Crotalaria pallida TaxID=3830 RepID=A0AAN9HU78_CROPI
MQTVKDKLQDMSALRKAKAEAKAEEKAEKDIAKARMDIAHEVRRAKEAEAAMELHVAKAGERAEKEIAKHSSTSPNAGGGGGTNLMNPGTFEAANDPISGNNIHGSNIHGTNLHGSNMRGTNIYDTNVEGVPHDLQARK